MTIRTRREQINDEAVLDEYSPELLEEAEIQGVERDLFLDMAFRSIKVHNGNLDGFYAWWYERKLWQRKRKFNALDYGLINVKIDEFEESGNTWPNIFTSELLD